MGYRWTRAMNQEVEVDCPGGGKKRCKMKDVINVAELAHQEVNINSKVVRNLKQKML